MTCVFLLMQKKQKKKIEKKKLAAVTPEQPRPMNPSTKEQSFTIRDLKQIMVAMVPECTVDGQVGGQAGEQIQSFCEELIAAEGFCLRDESHEAQLGGVNHCTNPHARWGRVSIDTLSSAIEQQSLSQDAMPISTMDFEDFQLAVTTWRRCNPLTIYDDDEPTLAIHVKEVEDSLIHAAQDRRQVLSAAYI